MNYSNYNSVDVVNGTGTRCSLFVSGCSHACKGCFNQKTWSPDSGIPFTKETEDMILADLKDTRIKRQGISLSGGDPLFHSNIPVLTELCERIKRETEADIWLWTGYTFTELPESSERLIELVDVLIDGKFEEDKKDLTLKWRGSSNQNVIYLN